MTSEFDIFSRLMNLPSPIIFDIFSRLPTNKIMQSKCVSKTLQNLLSGPEFVNFHLPRSPKCLLVTDLYSWPPDSSLSTLVDFEDEPKRHDLSYRTGSKVKIPKGRKNSITIVGSINGLVCLIEFERQGHYEAIYVWNPTIKQTVTIPISENVTTYPHVVRSYGFGFSAQKGVYKVVRISQELKKGDRVQGSEKRGESTCEVFALGIGSWRSIGHAPSVLDAREHGIFLNGNLHWLAEDSHGFGFISCLDLDNEQFQHFDVPPVLNQRIAPTTLNLYDSCLSVCDTTSDAEMVIWVLRKSWCKEVVIKSYPTMFPWQRIQDVHIIKVFTDGEILLSWGKNTIVSYHPDRKTFLSLDARDLTGAIKRRTCLLEELMPSIEAVHFVSSFVSPKYYLVKVPN